MTHETVSLGKYWKLFPVTLNVEFNYNFQLFMRMISSPTEYDTVALKWSQSELIILFFFLSSFYFFKKKVTYFTVGLVRG